MRDREGRLAAIERALAPRRASQGMDRGLVVTIHALRGMPPAELVDVYREAIRGRITVETGADRQRVEIPDPASLSAAERAAIYRDVMHHGR